MEHRVNIRWHLAMLALLGAWLPAPAVAQQISATQDTLPALGTRGNPVLARGPGGQHEYLQRLRCSDGTVPVVTRRGSAGESYDGHILDTYTLRCGSSDSLYYVVMDMYHGPERERRPVAPFTVLPEHPARLAQGCPPRVVADGDSSARYVFTWYEVERPAQLTEPPPENVTGPVDGIISVSFVIDRNGTPEPSSIKHAARTDTALLALGTRLALARRYLPAEHRVGCRVRQFGALYLPVRKAN